MTCVHVHVCVACYIFSIIHVHVCLNFALLSNDYMYDHAAYFL